MDLCLVHRPILETYGRNTLALPPLAFAITTPQTPQLPDGPPGRDRLHIADRTDDLEVHLTRLA